MGNFVRDLLLRYNQKRNLVFEKLISIFAVDKSKLPEYNDIWDKLLKYIDTSKNPGLLIATTEGNFSKDYFVYIFRVFSDTFYVNSIELDSWKDVVNSKFATLAPLADTLAAILYHMTSVSMDENDIEIIRNKLERSGDG